MSRCICLLFVLLSLPFSFIQPAAAQSASDNPPSRTITITPEQRDEFITRLEDIARDLKRNLDQGINEGTDADGSAVVQWVCRNSNGEYYPCSAPN